MVLVDVLFVHRVAAHPSDRRNDVSIPASAFQNRIALGKALRAAGVLEKSARIRSVHTEGDRTIVFPDRGIWHSVTLVNPSR